MKRRLSLYFLALLVLAAGRVWGQPHAVSSEAGSGVRGGIDGVYLGFVADPEGHRLQPIQGIPGASMMGEPLHLGVSLSGAAVSPRQDYILAPAGRDLKPVQFRAAGGRLVARRLEGVMPGADRIAVSPEGSAAAFYDAGQGRIQILTGLPDSPSVLHDLDAGSISTRRPLRSIAVSDDGGAFVATLAEGDGESVFFLETGGPARFLVSVRRVSAMTFLSQSRDLLIADQWNKEVYRVQDVSGPAAITLLAGEQEGIEAPFAVAASRDNRRAFIANSRSGTIAIVDLASGAASLVSCRCQPTGLHPLRGDSVFRLTDPSEGPLWLLDAASAQPRIVFVPHRPGPADEPSEAAGRATPRNRRGRAQPDLQETGSRE